jgi:hypothetical protein
MWRSREIKAGGVLFEFESQTVLMTVSLLFCNTEGSMAQNSGEEENLSKPRGISLENTCELKEILFIGCEAVNNTTNYLNPLISEA